jgi:peptidoglycan/LPS O-acetylase OafA/YrhL
MTIASERPQRRVLDLGVLDALRGLTALYVVLHHAQWLLWWPDVSAVHHGVLPHIQAALAQTLRFGHQAVLVFFLISGFCIHYGQAKAAAHRPPGQAVRWLPLDLGSYAWRRLRRLYPPLLAALVLTTVLDVIGARIDPSYYLGATQYSTINASLIGVGDRAWTTVLGNIGLQSGLAVPMFGTDTPLWSLSYEFWYYALYPVLLIASTRFGVRGMLVLAGSASALGLATVFGQSMFEGAWVARMATYWIVWTAGAVLAEADVGRLRLPRLAFISRLAVPAAVVVVGLLIANTVRPRLQIEFHVEDMVWSVAFVVLLAWGMLDCPVALAAGVQRIARWLCPLGKMSYSLYVVHMPWLALLSAWWLSQNADLPSSALLAAVGVGGALGLASVSWYLVERHCVSRRPSRAPARVSMSAELAGTSVVGAPSLLAQTQTPG